MRVEEALNNLKEFTGDFPKEHFCPPGNNKLGKGTISDADMNLVFSEVRVE